jgi:hypothetical protein
VISVLPSGALFFMQKLGQRCARDVILSFVIDDADIASRAKNALEIQKRNVDGFFGVVELAV